MPRKKAGGAPVFPIFDKLPWPRGSIWMITRGVYSIITHKCARYAVEGVLNGFATDAAVNGLADPNIIMFSERNSRALDSPQNSDYGNVGQDDYDAWVGESALVRWGSGIYANEGWIEYNRHQGTANYIYTD